MNYTEGFGMDQIIPIMGDNHELFDYSEEYTNSDINRNINNKDKHNNSGDNNNNDDDKYIINEEQKKENFIPDQPIIHGPQLPTNYSYIPSTNQLIKSIYEKLQTNIMYLFVIFILIIVVVAQKNNMDQMKLLLMISLNNNSPNSLLKTPIL